MNPNQNDDLMQDSLLGFFSQSQETLDDAKRKQASETTSKTQFFQMNSDGTYAVRILPLAPVIGPDGVILPMERKGYEYPMKDIFLRIDCGVSKNGKPVTKNVPVCHTAFAFPGFQNDLIDLYVRLACEANSGDKKFCDKITSNSFNGGLKYNRRRCMYVLDMNERNKGLQILQMSFSQYRDLDDAKIRLWGKLAAKNRNTTCPISSPMGAYPVEITRKTENGKVSYSINIDTISGVAELTPEELQTLLDSPRLPEALYTYRRRHLEATIVFLRQQDAIYNLKIMDTDEIKDCIDQIKMLLPADDNSHFSLSDDSDDSSKATSLEMLWEAYEEQESKNLDDRSEEGQNLRAQLREFIEANNLEVVVSRKKTNLMVLEELQELLDAGEDNNAENEDEVDSLEPAYMDEGDDEEAEIDERNDDTNEPAVRPRRLASRNIRKRN